jgi:hypothetical protein
MTESVKIQKRLVPIKYYQDSQVSPNMASIGRIDDQYGAMIRQYALWSNLPAYVILAWVFVESAGQNAQPNRFQATGLMQVTPATANETIRVEYRTKRMNTQEKTELIKHIGQARFDCIVGQAWDGEKKSCNGNKGVSISSSDLLKPAFNLLVGTLYLKQMVDRHTEAGMVRLDKVIVNYNAGRYAKVPDGTPIELYAKVGAIETKNYITKVAGINGLLETIV